MTSPILTTTNDLTALCERCIERPYITVDTEFLREKTYYPLLCLIQIGLPATTEHPAEEILIDTLADDIDLTALRPLFFDPDILKVFHAASQDLEILSHLFNQEVPTPLFDTQIAAMVTGYGDQTGYQTLVKRICHTDIDKSFQYTDWSARPLQKKQLEYATGDVTYLREIYEHLKELLDEKGRWDWMASEMEALQSAETYTVHPDELWRKVKIRSDKPKSLATLQSLTAWRETCAQNKNLPRSFIMKDDVLSALARQMPKTENDLKHVRGLPEKYKKGTKAKDLLSLIKVARQTPTSKCPTLKKKTPLPIHLSPSLELLKMLLRVQAAKHDVVPRLIAPASEIQDFIISPDMKDITFLKGWRYEVFGQYALRLLEGKIALRLNKHDVVFECVKSVT